MVIDSRIFIVQVGLDVGAVQVAACADAISSLGGLVDDIASFWAGGPDQLE